MNDEERMRRSDPARDASIRSSWAGRANAGSNHPAPDAAVDEVVAHAVRVGYQVIGENIRQGRVAADRLRAGDYSMRELPDELGQLSRRLLQLTRDLSTTAFDLFGAILRDPGLRSAVERYDPPPRAGRAAASGPALGAVAAGVTGASQVTRQLPLTYNLKGNKQAVATATTLRNPEQPTLLSATGLSSLNHSLPPLRNVSFAAAADGYGVVATIDIPEDQPPGIYSGVVCAVNTHEPLGTLTVQVNPS